MVQGMVDRLATRLRQIARRRRLDQADALADGAQRATPPRALRSGLAAFQNDTATQQRLRTAASRWACRRHSAEVDPRTVIPMKIGIHEHCRVELDAIRVHGS